MARARFSSSNSLSIPTDAAESRGVAVRRRSRRLKFGAISASLLLGVLVIAVLFNVLSARFSRRFDVTATGDQQLSGRTLKTLAQLTKPHRIVIAAPMSSIDRRAKESVGDLLRDMQRESPTGQGISAIMLDTGTAAGLESYRQLLTELAERDGSVLRQQSAAIELTLTGLTPVASYLRDSLSPALLAMRDSVAPDAGGGLQNREFFERTAAAARVASDTIAPLAVKVRGFLKNALDGLPVPETDRAAAAVIETAGPLADQLGRLAMELRRLSDGGGKDLADAAKALARDIDSQRDQLTVLLDPLRLFKRPDILRVHDVLNRGSAALIIGPPESGVSALDIETLFPTAEWLRAAQLSSADLGRRAEELITTGLAVMAGRAKPIVVFMHAEPRRDLDLSSRISELIHRLRIRGMDTIEWACSVEAEAPGLTRFKADGPDRPVVYVAISPDSSGSAARAGEPNGIQKAEKLGATLEQLLSRGENLLLCLNPSIFPASGSVDPLSKVLGRFGLASLSGRPLMRERYSPQRGRQAAVDALIQARQEVAGDRRIPHPILGALGGLPTYFPWPIAISRAKSTAADGAESRADASALYSIAADNTVWAESQWLNFWHTRAEDRPLSADQPAFDAARDTRTPEDPAGGGKDWVVAAATQLPRGGGQLQRLVVVGSNGWFLDAITQRGARVDGRLVPLNPGNAEFFDASLAWLAGQEDLIAQSPSAKILPVIQNVEQRRLLTLRFAVIMGMPALVLILGAAYRIVRG